MPSPGNFRIGKHDRGNRTFVKYRRMTQDDFDGMTAFMIGLVSQHWLAGRIADHKNIGLTRSQ